MSIPQSTNNYNRFLRILFLMGGKLLYSVVLFSFIVAVVQWPSPVRLFATPWTAARQASLSLTIFWSLPKFMFIALVVPSSQLILWCPLLLLPSIFLSIRDFSSELPVCIRWPKYWSFSFSVSPSSEYPGFISFKTDWFDLLAVQGTFRRLLQHHSSKASILWRSAFFTVQLSQPYVTTRKTMVLTYEPYSALWLYEPGSCLWFSICRLGLPSLSCQEAITVLCWFLPLLLFIHPVTVCGPCPQWFWSLRRGNLSLLPPFPLLSAMQ